jgi:pyochelin synthetase
MRELLAELHRRDIKLRLVDGRVDVLAPPDSLSPELREALRLHRHELRDLLARASVEDGHSTGPVPDPEHRYDPFPLTDIQHAYWVGRHSGIELGGVATHFYMELERTGLDVARLEGSLRTVIDRHDMLRAVVDPDGQQRILAEVPPYELPVSDLRGLDDERAERLSRIQARMRTEVRPTDRWPLFGFHVCLFEHGVTRLLISLDLLIMDAGSLLLLFDEWRHFYQDPDWAPEPPALSFRDHVLAEEAARTGSRYRKAEEYWLARLDRLPAAPALPLAAQPAAAVGLEFTRRSGRLDRTAWAAVKESGRRRGLTPSGVLLTAFSDVLRTWSEQPAFTLNLTLFNRPRTHPDLARLIGDFTSVTMLQVAAPDAHDSFTVRGARLQRQLLEDLDHSAFSGIRVLRERARRAGGGPAATMPIVFTSALGVRNEGNPSEGLRFFGEQVDGISQTPQVWLDHQVTEECGDLVFNWDAAEALFPPRLLDDLFAAYREELHRLAGSERVWDVDEPVVGLPAWQLAERVAASATATPIPEQTLSGLVEAQAVRTPDAVAVVDPDGRWTYTDLVTRARRLARRLTDLGAQRDTLVGVVLEKGRDQVAAVLGVAGSPAAYLPIDPQWPQARRWQLIDQGAVRVVVTSPRLRDELAWPEGVTLVTLSDPEVRAVDAGPLEAGPAPGDLAYVIFTSGSTGVPKGVMIDHRGAANTVQDINQRFGVRPGDRVLALSSLSFDLSVWDVFGVLAAGGTVVMPRAAAAHDPAHWTELVERECVTVWNSVPALMQVWLDSLGSESEPPPLRLVLLSGDWIPVTLPGTIRALAPDAEVISLGGATEASIWSIAHPIRDVPPEWTRIPYGRPLANQTMHVLDGHLRPRPVWTPGELFIGGVGVAQGYWAEPERTAERFVVHPVTGERLYRTGDLGRYLPGGEIDFLGRSDHQVKVNGYRIELGEIEAALLRQPEVAEAVATVAIHPQTGRRQLIGYVSPARAATVEAGTGSSWPDAVDAGAAEVRRAMDQAASDLRSFERLWHALVGLAPLVMGRTLARLGIFLEPDDRATAADIIRRGDLKPQYEGLVAQWLATLEAERVLVRDGGDDRYRCREPFDGAALDAQVHAGLRGLADDHRWSAFPEYVAAAADAQVDLVRGRTSPLELFLADGDRRVTQVLYADNPVNRLLNRAAGRVVAAFTSGLPGRGPDRPVRILEVGAGTGATSAEVLAVLPVDGSVRYSFTDVSTFFTEQARRSFAQYPFVEYGRFDVDRAPAEQGWTPASADVVIAANVLHDAADLGSTLEKLRSVLTPGGLLLLIEGTANTPLQMITVGFIEGFSRHEAQRELPLLSVPEWREQLAAAGFQRSGCLPAEDEASDAMVQHLLLSEAPLTAATVDPQAVRAVLEEHLPEYMVPGQLIVLDRMPLTANGKVDRAALPDPWPATTSADAAAPRDELERDLLELWRGALGRDDFGVDDNFFELGGDSLHAVHVLGQVRKRCAVDFAADEALELLFSAPTISAFAAAIREVAGGGGR